MMHCSCSGLSFSTNQVGICILPKPTNPVNPEDEIKKLVFRVKFYFVFLKRTCDFPESKRQVLIIFKNKP